jgi:hypothetical protein
MSTKDGGPAFPQTEVYEQTDGGWRAEGSNQPGMSLRDYFAAKAITELKWSGSDQSQNIRCAAVCYQIADAMLAAREVQV